MERGRPTLIAAGALALFTCRAEIPEGSLTCLSSDDCPEDWLCLDGFCWSKAPCTCADDGVACTVEQCEGDVCVHAPNHAACEDSVLCTADTCTSTGCQSLPNDSACPVLNGWTGTCDPDNGCQYPVCDPSSTCLPDNACQVVNCANGVCQRTPRQCDDGNPCTVDSCDLVLGCNSSLLIQCDDGNPCTVNGCNASSGCDFSQLVSCDDNNACTVDACDPSSGCSPQPVTCDDGNPCTVDACNPSSGCDFSQLDPCADIACHDHSGSCGTSDVCQHTFGTACDLGCAGYCSLSCGHPDYTSCDLNSFCVSGACVNGCKEMIQTTYCASCGFYGATMALSAADCRSWTITNNAACAFFNASDFTCQYWYGAAAGCHLEAGGTADYWAGMISCP